MSVSVDEAGPSTWEFRIEGPSLGRRTEPLTLCVGEDLELLFAACCCNKKLEKDVLPENLSRKEKKFLSFLIKEFHSLEAVEFYDSHTVRIKVEKGKVLENFRYGIVEALCFALRVVDAEVIPCGVCLEEEERTTELMAL